MPNTKFDKHVTIKQAGNTLIQALADSCPELSRSQLKKALLYGAVWLSVVSAAGKVSTSRVRRAKKILSKGDEVHIYYDEHVLSSDIVPAKLVADEGGYSIWNKPCGMLSQGSKWGDHTAISRWVELFGLPLNNIATRPTFLVHRLDRATQGLIIVAHSKKATSMLAALFQTREVTKQYLAKVAGRVSTVSTGYRFRDEVDGRPASTLILGIHYEPEEDITTLHLQLETGRKHQIRKHLANSGLPIIGDRLYGANQIEQSKPLPDLQLQSCFLAFDCPLTRQPKHYSLLESLFVTSE